MNDGRKFQLLKGKKPLEKFLSKFSPLCKNPEPLFSFTT